MSRLSERRSDRPSIRGRRHSPARFARDRSGCGRDRRASILVVVVIVLAILALGAYTFSEYMLVEARSTQMFARDAQARAAADSGIELSMSLLTQRYEQSPHSYHANPAWFQGVTLQESESPKGRLRFSIVSAVESDTSGRQIRFGLQDESARLNINAIPKLVTDLALQRQMLMYIPNMTEQFADAILDWVDADSNVRDNGAESDSYSSLGYQAKNGPLDSLDELLLVQGVTAQLLFGEDANRNGLLDPVENDGAVSAPFDNADGLLDHGWAAYLSVNGRESNLKPDGTTKVNVNISALGDLYDQLQPVLGDEAATFIMAYRLKGPVAQSTGNSNQVTAQNATSSSGSRTGTTSGGGGGSGDAKVSTSAQASKDASKSTNSAKISKSADVSQQKNSAKITNSKDASKSTQGGGGGGGAVQQAASAVSSTATMAGQGSVTRANIDVTAGGSTNITSLYDLLDAQVQVQYVGSNSTTTLDSPWTSDASSLRNNMPKLVAELSTSDAKTIDGRINVNYARLQALSGIPNITPTIAEQIVAAQSAGGTSSDRDTTAWLLANGIVDLDMMRQLDKYVTARGDVYRLQSVGYFERGGPSARIEAVIDSTLDPPQVVFLRDLTDLGQGYSAELLTTGTGGTQ